MTLINGQEQPASSQRERELGRQGLEPGRGKESLLALDEPENAAPHHRSWLVGDDSVRAYSLHHDTQFEGQSARNLGFKPKPEIQGKGYSTAFPGRSRQRLIGLAQGYKNVCERWSLGVLGMATLLHLEEETGLCNLILSGQVRPMTGDLKDRMALVIGISIGLGELFDDDKDAELQWLASKRTELGGVSPLEHMLKGDLLYLRDIVDLVDNARGLR